jgi:phospholipase/lecithinase/hemolysin
MASKILTLAMATLAAAFPRPLPPRAVSNVSASGTQYFITFGDSYSQTGFDINGTHPSAANPLGNPALPGYTASGGLDWVGFEVTKYNASLLLSYNLAYGGATTDASLVAPYADTVLSFVDQVGEFSASLAAKPDWAPWTASDTLVGVWMGVNDVGNTFWLSNMTDVLDAVTTRYIEQLQVTYDAGARNFVVLTVPRKLSLEKNLFPKTNN